MSRSRAMTSTWRWRKPRLPGPDAAGGRRAFCSKVPATAKLYDRGEVPASEAERNFCRFCGSFLWLYDPRWPDLVHPFASAIDTSLPKPPEHVRLMLNYAPTWCEIPTGEGESHFPEYPEESLEEWHQ